ncbi:TetR/AcrR family transcriptional regulator [Actinomadura sp. 9N407]|uniref:TetR/AcrR family transcriptional regulator n=1 Tax=Actinomadura sp. 9N407 TaxID=3375154 RepID=UPI0037A9314B
MPRLVDHAERRATIAQAVVRLVATKGVEAASLRSVAAEAGMAMGTVQHYFKTRDEMLLFALRQGNELLTVRVRELLDQRKPATLREQFRLVLSLLLPFDDDGRAGARLWAGMISRACVDDPTRGLATEAYTNLTAFVDRQLAQAVQAHHAREGLDVPQAARHLVSVIEGLRWPLLFGAYTDQEALAVLDAHLDLIFT